MIFNEFSIKRHFSKLKFFKLKRSLRFVETVMFSSDLTRTYLENQAPV